MEKELKGRDKRITPEEFLDAAKRLVFVRAQRRLDVLDNIIEIEIVTSWGIGLGSPPLLARAYYSNLVP